MNLPLGSNDKSVIVWCLGGNLNVDSELVKPCSAFSHYGNNNSEVSGWKVIFIGDTKITALSEIFSHRYKIGWYKEVFWVHTD
jgi:hypothetical protein